jgi:hypothetical protein
MDISLPPKLIYPFPMRTLGTRGKRIAPKRKKNKKLGQTLNIHHSTVKHPQRIALRLGVTLAFVADMVYEVSLFELHLFYAILDRFDG